MMINNKWNAITGVAIGLIMFYAWVFLLQAIVFLFFSQAGITHGAQIVKSQAPIQIITWLETCLLPIFIIYGHFLMVSGKK